MPRQTDTRARARAEFARRLTDYGYLGVSPDDFAKAVDVRKAGLYHRFPGGKPALFTEVADHCTRESRHSSRAPLAPGDPRDKLLALAASHSRGTDNSALSNQISYATRRLEATSAPAVAGGELREADPGFPATALPEPAGTVNLSQEHRIPDAAGSLALHAVELFLGGRPGRAPTRQRRPGRAAAYARRSLQWGTRAGR